MSLVPLGKRPSSSAKSRNAAFLPTTRADMEARGWDQLDILIVTGDAYVDHPAFGPVLIARFLEGRGFKVGIIAQPKWDSPADLCRMGAPRLYVGIAAGNLDSMLNTNHNRHFYQTIMAEMRAAIEAGTLRSWAAGFARDRSSGQ